ncbi:hypothetical protein B5F09_14050, partial [Erysipelatoclostridium sp. An173]|uniref:tetratricopeptide repeat protein n=1 Tax=Erysipelatoclostridium sp. An173 TaxID=1965571 RepID=UPI000B552A30
GGIFLAKTKIKEKEYQNKITTAQRYVEEKEYEKAEETYLEAIDIEPKEPQAYVELADVYVEQDEFDQANDILDTALKNVDKQYQVEITKKKDEIEIVENAKKSYDELLSWYINSAQNGFTDNNDQLALNSALITEALNNDNFMTLYYYYGDINNDDIKELFIGANKSEDIVIYAIWTYENDKLKNIINNYGFYDGEKESVIILKEDKTLSCEETEISGAKTEFYWKLNDNKELEKVNKDSVSKKTMKIDWIELCKTKVSVNVENEYMKFLEQVKNGDYTPPENDFTSNGLVQFNQLYYSIYDISNDGINELILTDYTDKPFSYNEIYTYNVENRSIEYVGCVYCYANIFYSKDLNKISVMTTRPSRWGTGEQTYQIVDGILKEADDEDGNYEKIEPILYE